MLTFRRIVRAQFGVKRHFHTSNILRCDRPENSGSIENKTSSDKKKFTKINENKPAGSNASKKKLTAELNAKDYANFKFQKSPTANLYLNKSSQKEKLEATKSLRNLTKEIESEKNIESSLNEKLKTIAVSNSKKNAKIYKNKLVESAKALAVELGGDTKKTEGDILGYLKILQLKTETRKSKQDKIDVKRNTQAPRHFNSNKGKYFKENQESFIKDKVAKSKNGQKQEVEHHNKIKESFQQSPDGTSQHSRRDFKNKTNKTKIADVILHKRYPEFKALGIFKAADLKDDGPKLKIWEELEDLELKVATTFPPQNYFEELIQWTKEGKLWHFPIDNDQGNEVEANIYFTEHIFLEEHLEPWCPKRGPLRHFMELVLTGLAKNYHLTVEEKKEHIYWYRDYFEGKKKLLQEMGALDSVKVLQESAESNSENENVT